LWGGNRRSDPAPPAPENGDIVVRGGPARFVYHGVAPLKDPIGSIEGIRDPSPFLFFAHISITRRSFKRLHTQWLKGPEPETLRTHLMY
jgi:hypothetical protein